MNVCNPWVCRRENFMINAKEARELSRRCEEYCNAIIKHLKTIESRIKDCARTGGSVITYNLWDEGDQASLAYDLEEKLREYSYRVGVLRLNNRYSLQIRW